MSSSPFLARIKTAGSENLLRPQRSISQRFRYVSDILANLNNTLLAGIFLAFTLLIPLFTCLGSCDHATRVSTIVLLTLLSISCFLRPFTDSFTARDGYVYYGIATPNSMWVFDYADVSGLPDLRHHRIRIVDWMHAFLSVLLLISVVMMNKNVVSCFFPEPHEETKQVLDILSMCIGIICSLLLSMFPSRRQGFGYAVIVDG